MMPDMLSFIVWTFLILVFFPALVEIYIERKGIVSLVCMYIAKSEAEYLKDNADSFDTLPTDAGQVFAMMRFKRAVHSQYNLKLASKFTSVLIRTRVYGTGAIECYEGERSLGVTHVVSLEGKRRKDIEFVNVEKYGDIKPKTKDLLICLLIWYASIPTLIFGSPRKVGYRTTQ